jgi:hypothetical protein
MWALWAVVAPTSEGERLADVVGSLIFAPLFAAVVVLALAMPYAPIFALWAWCARRVPAIERTRTTVTCVSVLLSIPGALVVANSRAHFGLHFDVRMFQLWFALAILSGAVGIAAPRWLFPSLHAGAFLRRTG